MNCERQVYIFVALMCVRGFRWKPGRVFLFRMLRRARTNIHFVWTNTVDATTNTRGIKHSETNRRTFLCPYCRIWGVGDECCAIDTTVTLLWSGVKLPGTERNRTATRRHFAAATFLTDRWLEVNKESSLKKNNNNELHYMALCTGNRASFLCSLIGGELNTDRCILENEKTCHQIHTERTERQISVRAVSDKSHFLTRRFLATG